MHKTFLIALAAAVGSAALAFQPAGATAFATPHALGSALAETALVRKAVNVCGLNGCARVQTGRVVHYRYRRP